MVWNTTQQARARSHKAPRNMVKSFPFYWDGKTRRVLSGRITRADLHFKRYEIGVLPHVTDEDTEVPICWEPCSRLES